MPVPEMRKVRPDDWQPPLESHGMEKVGLLRGEDVRLKASSSELKAIGSMETFKAKIKIVLVSGRYGSRETQSMLINYRGI